MAKKIKKYRRTCECMRNEMEIKMYEECPVCHSVAVHKNEVIVEVEEC